MYRLRDNTLSQHLLWLIASLILVVTTALTVTAGGYATARALDDQGALLTGVASRVANQLDQALAERWLDIKKISSLRTFQQVDADPDQQRGQLELLAESFPEYAWIGFADADGIVQTATDGLLEGADVSQRPWFINARHRAFIGDVHEAQLLADLLEPIDTEPVRFVDVAAPVTSTQGERVGVLGAHLYASWAKEVVESLIEPVTNRQSVSVLVLNSRREVVLGPPDFVGTPLDLDSARQVQQAPIGFVEEIWLDRRPGMTGFASADGFRNFPGLGWHVLVHRDRADVMRPIRVLQLKMTGSGILVGLIALVIGLVLSSRLSAPVRRLSERVRQTRDISEFETLQTGDGFAELDELKVMLCELAIRVRKSPQQVDAERAVGAQQREEIHALRRTATTDALTGVLNRRGLAARLRRLVDSVQHYPRPVTAIMFDLDHFKQVNDMHGHAVGDEVLIEIARRVGASLRDTDIFARSGGEEFVVVLPETEPATGADLAERLRRVVSDRPVATSAGDLAVTTSLGVASHTGTAPLDIHELLDRADSRLYAAKQAGRNCVKVETDPPSR